MEKSIGKPPLPDKLLNLKDIHKMKFFNTNFREYLCVYGDYIIGVYPFVINIKWSFKDNKPVTYDNFRLLNHYSMIHHNDFTLGKVDTDPCDIFEDVCGIKIHKNELDSHLMYLDHEDEIRMFESEIILQKRDNRLKDILIK
jgi:hypothetical protein